MNDLPGNSDWNPASSSTVPDSLASLELNSRQLTNYRRQLESLDHSTDPENRLQCSLEAVRLRSLAQEEFVRRHNLRVSLAHVGVDPQFHPTLLEAQIRRHSKIAQLTMVEFRPSESTTADCGICLETLNEGDMMAKLPCSHPFHKVRRFQLKILVHIGFKWIFSFRIA